ncbi:hypothetical protein AM1_A0070 (plasmid) [Acaryochloris marina MBIC11017]|uniref:Uncharacterized protein n=1 Tax=Acaryochloris marina (strain MBIC 11017) TaxID=329726 RepID=A8ZK79_ACAM1|nr:hypothetical protein AM1_A0070 [Acaryochloris marina MBIC11017]
MCREFFSSLRSITKAEHYDLEYLILPLLFECITEFLRIRISVVEKIQGDSLLVPALARG